MATTGLMFEKDNKPISNEILSLFETVRVAYLSARTDPKEYGGRWRNALEKIKEAYNSISPLGKEIKEYLDERHVEADDSGSPSSGTAKIIYEAVKQMRFDSENVNDPFAKKFKGNVLEALLSDQSTFVKFIHYAIRSDDDALSEDSYKSIEFQADDITDGLEGLDLQVKDVPLFIIEHYGDNKDSKKVESKFKEALNSLKEAFMHKNSEEDWNKLTQVELKKSMSAMSARKLKFKERMNNPTMRVEEKPDETQNVVEVEMDADVSGDCCEQAKQDIIDLEREIFREAAKKYAGGNWELFVKLFKENNGKQLADSLEKHVEEWAESIADMSCEELIGFLEYLTDPSREADEVSSSYSGPATYKEILNNYESCNSFGSGFSDKYAMLKAEKKSTEEKAISHFIIPNKPMYRIFDIDDMQELQGFSGDYLVQEKYDGMRIQIHKIDNQVKIYSYNEKDITDKCPEQVTEMKKKSYGDCILDAELILFDGEDALHRADTIAHVFKNKYPNAKLKAHVFDIMRHEEKNMTEEELEQRINILFNNYSAKSSDSLHFPSKKDTRTADSLKDIEEYAKEIMSMPTAEGVVIKDLTSTYFIGTKKNPKWVKWKKFVDLDMIVLDKKATKSKLYSYTLGAGPVLEEGKHIVELNGKLYMNVGKALNTKINVNIGDIIRVKVDEVKQSGDRYTLYSANVIEVPEVETPDKIVTLEMLSKDTKPSLKYKIEALTKGITITDNIHGEATLIAKSMDGFTIYGFEESNLMSKNALADLDMWKKEAEETLKTLQGKITVAIKNRLKEKGPQTPKEIHLYLKEKMPSEYETLFDSDSSKMMKVLGDASAKNIKEWANQREGIHFSNGKLDVDDTDIAKEMSEFKIYSRKDDNLDFIIQHKGETLSWLIDLPNDDDIFSLFGKANKYPAKISKNISKGQLLDEGPVEIGVQRHGYHEYIIKGNKFETKVHFRVIPVDDQQMWLAWTGYEQKPVDKETDEGVWNIYEDKYRDIDLPKNTE